MIVGEAPSPNRKSFENFSEKSREVLDQMLQELGLDRSRVYLTNAIKCQLIGVSKKKKEEVLSNCLIYLKREIEIVQPRVILALGETAKKSIVEVKPKVDAIFVDIFLPHPMVVVYGSMKLEDYLKLVREKCGLIRYLM
jgi:DNA polymerase